MTSASGDTSKTSPWFSVWFRPGDTIERILATKRGGILLLAGIGTASGILATAIDSGLAAALTDWRTLAAAILVGMAGGVVLLYVNAFFIALVGKVFRGRASQPQIRAALAWSQVPNAAGLAICLSALIGLRLSGGADSPQPMSETVGLAVSAVTRLLELWALIAAVLMLRRVQGFGAVRATAALFVGWIVSAVVIALPIRTFLFQPFNTPSGSMKPTLLIGDYLFVSKYSYGYTHYSLPFSPPLFSGRIFASEPARGDVVVFRLPSDDSVDYIKRIVGLPGDRVQMIDGVIHINGMPVARERVEDFVDPEDGSKIRRWRETLPNGVSYLALDLTDNGLLDNTSVYNVPPGHYFMLGDNLDNSTDSRVLSAVGYVPFENLVGRAEIIYFSIDLTGKKEPTVRYERIGTAIR